MQSLDSSPAAWTLQQLIGFVYLMISSAAWHPSLAFGNRRLCRTVWLYWMETDIAAAWAQPAFGILFYSPVCQVNCECQSECLEGVCSKDVWKATTCGRAGSKKSAKQLAVMQPKVNWSARQSCSSTAWWREECGATLSRPQGTDMYARCAAACIENLKRSKKQRAARCLTPT